MKITLNSINAVTGVITNDEPLRQGNVGANTLTAVFEGKSNLAYTATFNYTRSDDGRLKDIPMTPTANAGEYYYKFSNPWFFALYGETTLTVYLKNASNEIVASGQITFPIEQTDFDDDPNITYSEYELLLEAITAKQDKFEIYNVRGYNTLELAEADPGLDDGQIVIVRGNPTKIYQVQAGELAPLDSVGAYLPLSGGTMSGAISQPVAPVVDDDLANKKYVDDSVKVATDDIADIIDGDIIVHTAYHAEMDIYGNVIPTYYQPKLTFDDTPTTGSANPVKSGGIKTYVDNRVGFDTSSLTTSDVIRYSQVGVLTKAIVNNTTPIYILKSGETSAIAITATGVYLYAGSSGGTTWTLSQTLSKESETGYSLALNPTTYVLTLKNKAGGTLSSVDLPLESVVVSGSYDDTTQSIILTLQNGTEITIPVADLVDGLVPNTRTIAGVDLADDITSSELNTALGVGKTDIVVDTDDYVSLELDSKPVQVQSAIEDKNGADITTTYATASRVSDIEAVIPSVASPTNQLTVKSGVVKIMTAPASTTLTDDQITQFINGVYINGTFLGYVNPVFYPARVTDATYYYGVLCGASEYAVAMERVYRINKTTKVIDLAVYAQTIFLSDGRSQIQISGLNGATFPATNPSGTEPYDLTIANNVYSFRERIYEYANMYLSNNATAVSLTADTLTKFAIPMTGGASSGITISTADDNLTILKTGVYQIIVTFNTSVSVNDLTLEAGVYKNTSTAIPELKQIRTAKNASTIDTSTLQGIVSLTANDVLDVRVKADGDCDMTVINATISVRRIS